MTLVERFKLFVDAVAAQFKAQEAEINRLRSAQGGGKKEYREMYVPRSEIKFSEGNMKPHFQGLQFPTVSLRFFPTISTTRAYS